MNNFEKISSLMEHSNLLVEKILPCFQMVDYLNLLSWVFCVCGVSSLVVFIGLVNNINTEKIAELAERVLCHTVSPNYEFFNNQILQLKEVKVSLDLLIAKIESTDPNLLASVSLPNIEKLSEIQVSLCLLISKLEFSDLLNQLEASMEVTNVLFPLLAFISVFKFYSRFFLVWY
ncbi:MAG: hypothetical protein JKY42_00575 [Flavobacteriales bacterium]|nr:hypothetical protein [Flavobacteriales bacterium]